MPSRATLSVAGSTKKWKPPASAIGNSISFARLGKGGGVTRS